MSAVLLDSLDGKVEFKYVPAVMNMTGKHIQLWKIKDLIRARQDKRAAGDDPMALVG